MKNFLILLLMLLFITPVFADSFDEQKFLRNYAQILVVARGRLFNESYISRMPFGIFKVDNHTVTYDYNNKDKIYQIGSETVHYSFDGSIDRIGSKRVKYDEKGRIRWLDNWYIGYDPAGDVCYVEKN